MIPSRRGRKGSGLSNILRRSKRLAAKDFVKKALEIHGIGRFDYSRIDYDGSNNKVIIRCMTCGKDFSETPLNHIKRNRCLSCSNKPSMGFKEFSIRGAKIHGEGNYDYSKVCYDNSRTKVTIVCNKCNREFYQTPSNHLRGNRCPECSKRDREKPLINREDFIIRSQRTHGRERYDYTSAKYRGASTKVKIWCHKCNTHFHQSPYIHYRGSGCPGCVLEDRREVSMERFLERAREIHGRGRYGYSDMIYRDSRTKICIRCLECEEDFSQTPESHINGGGCPRCRTKRGYSNICLEWLSYREEIDNVVIRNAESPEGEFRIPGTRYHADGYCEGTNTIYEFYGDYWHGNPDIFPSDGLFSRRTGETFGDKYKRTIDREEEIASKGYTIVTIWETEWRRINRELKCGSQVQGGG